MQVLVAKAVLRRPWIKASHLAGTPRALKIAPMQDPEIALACAAIGLLERRGKEDEELCAFLQQKDTGNMTQHSSISEDTSPPSHKQTYEQYNRFSVQQPSHTDKMQAHSHNQTAEQGL